MSKPAAAAPSEPEATSEVVHVFRLYVTGATPISARAIVNARSFFDRHLPEGYRLEICNVADHIASARADQVIASPTLIRLQPLPQQRFIGDLADTARLMTAVQPLPMKLT